MMLWFLFFLLGGGVFWGWWFVYFLGWWTLDFDVEVDSRKGVMVGILEKAICFFLVVLLHYSVSGNFMLIY